VGGCIDHLVCIKHNNKLVWIKYYNNDEYYKQIGNKKLVESITEIILVNKIELVL